MATPPVMVPPLRDTAPELVEFTTICPATLSVPPLTVTALPLAPRVRMEENDAAEAPPEFRNIRREPVRAKEY